MKNRSRVNFTASSNVSPEVLLRRCTPGTNTTSRFPRDSRVIDRGEGNSSLPAYRRTNPETENRDFGTRDRSLRDMDLHFFEHDNGVTTNAFQYHTVRFLWTYAE